MLIGSYVPRPCYFEVGGNIGMDSSVKCRIILHVSKKNPIRYLQFTYISSNLVPGSEAGIAVVDSLGGVQRL